LVTLEDVVATANRPNTEKAPVVPAAIQAVSGDALQRKNAADL
jgi:hypothetical protein